MYRNYSDSRLIAWLRTRVFKMKKPDALGWEEWDEWKQSTKAQHPIGWFFTETLPDWLEFPARFTIDPINDVRYYIKCRFFDQTHVLRTSLKPGQYYDLDTRFLHGLFNAFIEFVEIEKAHMHMVWGPDENRKKYKYPWHQRFWWTRWIEWRCPQAGLDYLLWESTLDHPDLLPEEQTPHQAQAAREQLALYRWWKETRPNRPDPYDASGWTAICEEGRAQGYSIFSSSTQPAEYKQRLSAANVILHKLEEDYEREDEEMLMRLLKIRKSLWT